MLLTETSPQPYDTQLADVWSLGVLIMVCARDGRRMWDVPEANDAGFAEYGLNAHRRHAKLGLADEVSMLLDMALVEAGAPLVEAGACASAAEMVEVVDRLGGPEAEWWAQRRL